MSDDMESLPGGSGSGVGKASLLQDLFGQWGAVPFNEASSPIIMQKIKQLFSTSLHKHIFIFRILDDQRQSIMGGLLKAGGILGGKLPGISAGKGASKGG